MSTKVSRFLTLGFVFSIALVLVFSSSTHAVDFNINVTRVWSNFWTKQISWGWQDSTHNTTQQTTSDQLVGLKYIKNMFFYSLPSPNSCVKGDIYELNFIVYQWQADNALDAIVTGNINVTTSGWEYITTKYLQGDNSVSTISMYFLKTANNTTCSELSFGIHSGQSNSNLMVLFSNESIEFISANILRPASGTDMSTVNNAVGNINSGISDININLNNVSDQLDSMQRSQNQANQDANDRYNDEKDTISDNGSTAQNSANGLSFGGFSIGNPLLNWVALFTDNACVSIPTIASWIHSNETQVCSPWSTSVRSVMTPIIGVLGGTILFGFLVNWLKQKDGQELS